MFPSGISFHAAMSSRHLQLKLYSDRLFEPQKHSQEKEEVEITQAMRRFLYNYHTNSIDQLYGADP